MIATDELLNQNTTAQTPITTVTTALKIEPEMPKTNDDNKIINVVDIKTATDNKTTADVKTTADKINQETIQSVADTTTAASTNHSMLHYANKKMHATKHAKKDDKTLKDNKTAMDAPTKNASQKTSPADNSQNKPFMIGFVDMQRIMSETPQAKMIAKMFDSEFDTRKTRISYLKRNLENNVNEIRGNQFLTVDEQNQQIQRLYDTITEAEKQAIQEYQQRHSEEMEKFLVIARKVIEAIAEEQEFSCILPFESALFVSHKVDITDAVIERFTVEAEAQRDACNDAPLRADPF